MVDTEESEIDPNSLEAVDGVGSGTVENLRDAGFDSASELADASVSELSDVKGFGTSRAEDVLEAATAHAGELSGNDGGEDEDADATQPEDISEDDTEESEDVSDSDDGGDEDGDSVGDDVGADSDDSEVITADIEFDLDSEFAYHVIHVVLEEATKQKQSSNYRLQGVAYDVADTLMQAQQSGNGGEITGTLTFSQDGVNSLYRALRRGTENYGSRSGITKMYGTLSALADDVNDVRVEIGS